MGCFHCNVYKGTNLSGIDPESGQVVPLFHPRMQTWAEHFAVRGAMVVGITPTGRATVAALRMNTPVRQQLRGQ